MPGLHQEVLPGPLILFGFDASGNEEYGRSAQTGEESISEGVRRLFSGLTPLAKGSLAQSGVDGDTILVSIEYMTSITSKELHERTSNLLDRVKQGQRFRVIRGGETDALLVPATDQIDPPWDDIMAEVRKARAQDKAPRHNPILAERKRREYAARVRR